ncbi:unnamed protein product [Blepharisma stoltei]|uniref:Kelch repeat-containing protein n=1 Tax=Blepharisma stoltei TaxID=1481888 RepID=A0AAU9KD34_9CILI|nr:unnamed protein product [Blepharisma stoltei]
MYETDINFHSRSLPKIKTSRRILIGPDTAIGIPKSLVNSHISIPEIPITRNIQTLKSFHHPSESFGENKKTFVDELIQRFSAGENAEFIDIATKVQRIKPLILFWEIKRTEGFIPEARVGATMVVVNGNIYLFGGQAGDRLNDIKMLDYKTYHWESVNPSTISNKIQEFPEPRVGHTAVSYKNSFIVYGGGGAFNQTLHLRGCFPLVHVFDTINLQWQTFKPLGRPPDARRNHGAVIIGNTMIIYGGIDSNSRVLSDLCGLNLEAMQWFVTKIDKGSVKPGPRHSFSFTSAYHPGVFRQSSNDIFSLPNVYDDIFTRKTSGIYLFGGMNHHGVIFNDLYMLQPKRKSIRDDESILKWVKLEPSGKAPLPRYNHSSALCGGWLYIIGGRNDTASFETIGNEVSDIAAYNIASCRWETLLVKGLKPGPRWGASAVSMGAKILCFGGMSLGGFCQTSLFSLETDQSNAQELVKLWEEEENHRKAKEEITLKLIQKGKLQYAAKAMLTKIGLKALNEI